MCVSLQPCCLRCRHVFLISLFLGAMTSSPVILTTAIVQRPWKDWAWHRACSPNEWGWESWLAGPGLTCSGACGQVCLQETPLPVVTLRSGLTDPGPPCAANSRSQGTHCAVGRAVTPSLCPQGRLLEEEVNRPYVRGAVGGQGKE